MKANIWQTAEGYVGATGVDTVRGMAELAIRERDIVEALGIEEWPTTVEAVEATLNEMVIYPVAVPAAIFRHETWETTHAITLDAHPGRGYVKVLGVHL